MEGITHKKRGMEDCSHAVGVTVLQHSRLLNHRQITYPPFSCICFLQDTGTSVSLEDGGTPKEPVLPQKEKHQQGQQKAEAVTSSLGK